MSNNELYEELNSLETKYYSLSTFFSEDNSAILEKYKSLLANDFRIDTIEWREFYVDDNKIVLKVLPGRCAPLHWNWHNNKGKQVLSSLRDSSFGQTILTTDEALVLEPNESHTNKIDDYCFIANCSIRPMWILRTITDA